MKKDYLSRRESIILSAIEIIDELGIQELSIRELANRQQVTEPAIYRHFKNKQDIILAVLDYYSGFDDMIINTINDKMLTAKEGIEFFNRAYAEYYENYPALTSIKFSYYSLIYDPVMSDKIKEIEDTRNGLITELIRRGQESREISDALTKEELTDIIVGLRREMILKWRMSNYSFSLKDRMMSALQSLLKLC